MREILFRGKRLDNGEWVEGYYIRASCSEIEAVIIPASSFVEHNRALRLEVDEWWEVDPTTVGQYTGLTDKNGKKIFEGDIVTFPWGGLGLVRFVMKWDDCCANFCAFPVKESADVWPIGLFGYEKHMEVIGNIHDNPELLEVSHDEL